jgi:hypothetical protein
MTYAPTRYIEYARRHFGQTRFDLATSGTASVDAAALRAAEAAAPEDPIVATARLGERIAAFNEVPPAEAMAALGTTHAIWLACAALLSPGDDVLVEDPAYEPLVRIPESLGARVRTFRREAAAGYALDAGAVGRAMTPATRLVVVSNLHNPTGVRAPDDDLRAVARVAQANGAHLLVDEVYAPFDALVDDRGVFAGSARKLGANVVTASSLTKCFGLGPERIGWLLGPPDVIERASHALVGSAGLLPRSHARVGLAAFAELPALAERSRGLLAGKRARVAAWVAARGLTWSAPAEGLFGLVTFADPRDLTPRLEAAGGATAPEADRVLVAPGAFFGVPNAFRLAWALPAADLDEALSRLGRLLDI